MNPHQKLTDAFGVTLSKKDLIRLRSHLGGWNKLNEILLLNGNISPDDLKRLILIELSGKCRADILRKLVTRLFAREQEILWGLVESCLSAK
jgi:hypothetical protein